MADYTPVIWNPGDTVTTSQYNALVAALAEEEAINVIQDSMIDRLTSSITTMPRWLVFTSGTATSGTVFYYWFTADRDLTVSQITVRTNTTAAAATPTLCRLGLYLETSTSGDLSQIAATPNDTTLFAAASTMYTKAFSSSVALTAGTRYAVALLVVSGVAVPNFSASGSTIGSAEHASTPRWMASQTGQTDLPSSVAIASMVNPGIPLYARLD